MNSRFINFYMDIAERTAKLSRAIRLQVGAIAVKDNRIISIGFNGTPAGWDNSCEEIIELDEDGGKQLKTKPEVIHAESNCISKLARTSESGEGATMFVTHAPCIECAKLIYQSGITSVYFKHDYRDPSGVNFLKKCNISITKVLANYGE